MSMQMQMACACPHATGMRDIFQAHARHPRTPAPRASPAACPRAAHPPAPQAATLQRALQHFTAAEVLDGDNRYRCPKNNKLVRAKKRITIEEAPNVLAVHLKRFDFFGRGEGRGVAGRGGFGWGRRRPRQPARCGRRLEPGLKPSRALRAVAKWCPATPLTQ